MRVKYGATTALVAGGLATAMALTGCASGGSTGSDSGSQTLTVWVDPNRAEELKDIAAQFEEDKGITVKLVQKEYGDVMKEDFVKQVPTGKGPDVIVGGHDWLGLGHYVNPGSVLG